MDSVFPDCLGCGVTVSESAVYCGKCLRAIKAHDTATRNKSDLDREAYAKQRAALEWPAHERGDLPGQWHERMAAAEFPLLSPEEQEAVRRRYEAHRWMAGQRRGERASQGKWWKPGKFEMGVD